MPGAGLTLVDMYTYKALGLMWLFILGLFALSGSGVAGDWWVLLLEVVAAAGVPFILTVCETPESARETSSKGLPFRK